MVSDKVREIMAKNLDINNDEMKYLINEYIDNFKKLEFYNCKCISSHFDWLAGCNSGSGITAYYGDICKRLEDDYPKMIKRGLRYIILDDGTGQGGITYVLKTNATKEDIKLTVETINTLYEQGANTEDIPDFSESIKIKGYICENEGSHEHVTSKNWLKEAYPEVEEEYVIENQPELSIDKEV